MELIGTIIINVKNKFKKLWYNKKKITLQYIFLTMQKGPKEAHEEIVAQKKENISPRKRKSHQAKGMSYK